MVIFQKNSKNHKKSYFGRIDFWFSFPNFREAPA